MNRFSKEAIIYTLACLFIFHSCVSPSSEDQQIPDEDAVPASYVGQDLSQRPQERKRKKKLVAADFHSSKLQPESKANQKSYEGNPYQHFPYNLMREDEVLFMPKELKTIGGLSMSPDKQKLIAINGQGGIIYYLDKQTGFIDGTVDLKKRGDFESIESVGEGIFLSKKNGTLVYVSDFDNEKPPTHNFNTKLSMRNEVEGLTYDPLNNELLLACKGKAGDGGILEDGKAIYVFQFDHMELLGQPMYMVTSETIATYFEEQDMEERLVDIVAENYPPEAYSPTSIAIHPHSGEIYWLAGEGKLMIVIDKDSKIQYMETLDPYLFSNPNGMCFDEDAVLYISNHGKGEDGKIYRFFKKEFQ